MSGLLRRIKRSRAADAGEAPAAGQAAAPDVAPTTAELPAGLEPAEAPLRPPAGRRGRLRRRLRYLRRARELMLRDLGGLLYEIHRTGGGDVQAHAPIVAAKVQRIAGLDAEAHALETALAAPRGDALVFQPGIGGTCAACGELYGSGARFCSSCGTPTAGAPPPVPEMPAPPDPPAAEADAETEPQADEAPTRALPAATAESAARNGRDADRGAPDGPAADPLAPEQSRP